MAAPALTDALDAAGWKVAADGIREKGGEKLSFDVVYAPLFTGSQAVLELTQQQLKAVGVVFPLVLTAVDDHEPGAQVDQEREARVVGQRRYCGGQLTLLRRRGGAVARHRAEHRLPVGCPDPLAEPLARHQVDLVAVGVGVADPERSGCLTKTRLLDRRGRPHHVEVDAVSKRARLRRLPDPYGGIAPLRIR